MVNQSTTSATFVLFNNVLNGSEISSDFAAFVEAVQTESRWHIYIQLLKNTVLQARQEWSTLTELHASQINELELSLEST